MLEKTLESPLDCKEIQPVHPKGDQSWVFTERTDAKAESPILWPPHAKSWLIGKDPDAGRDWGQEEKWTTEDEMAGWHHRFNGPESEWTPGVGDGQGDLVCCDSWGHKELDTTERLKWLTDWLKEPLDESEREQWQEWFKTQHSKNKDHGIRSHHFIANGETMKTVRDFTFLGSKITSEGDCSHKIKRCLLLWRKAMTNLGSALKCRDATLLNKVCIVHATVF